MAKRISAGSACRPTELIHPAYFRPEREAPYSDSSYEEGLAQIALVKATRSIIMSRLTAVLIGIMLFVQFAMLLPLRPMTAKEASAPPPALSASPIGVSMADKRRDELEKRFSQINSILSYLVTVTRTQGAPAASSPASASRPLVGIVTAEKANLRDGPGKEHPAIMAVSKGTELLIERKQDDWYQVTAPTGEPLWASTEVVWLDPKHAPN